MGLDSVELVMEMERYFHIRIPDTAAQKIYTVQDMADTVCLYRQVLPGSNSIRDQIFSRIKHYWEAAISLATPLKGDEPIANLLPDRNSIHWQLLQETITMPVPKPLLLTSLTTGMKNRFKRWMEWQPSYTWDSVTLGQFADAVCARNHKLLLNPLEILSRYDIYIGVMAVTAEKIGVEYYDILPEKSFTNDLGLD